MNFVPIALLLAFLTTHCCAVAEEQYAKRFRTFVVWEVYKHFLPVRHVGVEVETFDGKIYFIENDGTGTVINQRRPVEYDRETWTSCATYLYPQQLRAIGGDGFNLFTNNCYHARDRIVRAVDPTYALDFADSPLHSAAAENKADIVESMVQGGRDVDSQGSYQYTPLHYAAMFGAKEAAGMLLRLAANVNSRSVLGETPLSVAIKYDHLDVCKILLENGADVRVKTNAFSDSQGMEPTYSVLYSAVAFANPAIVKLLLKYGSDVNEPGPDGKTPLIMAAIYKKKEIAEILLENGANLDATARSSGTALQFAVYENDLEMTKLLLGRGANADIADRYGMAAIHFAARDAEAPILQLLLDHGANVNATTEGSRTALHLAAQGNRPENARVLLDAGASTEASVYAKGSNGSWTPLLEAVWYNSAAVAKVLLQRGANVSVRDAYRTTPLLRAAEKDFSTMIELLLENGARVEERDAYRMTPLLRLLNRAVKEPWHSFVVLTSHNASLEAKDTTGTTPLHYAAIRGHTSIAGELIRAEPTLIDQQDYDYESTPLHYASIHGNLHVARVLISAGANVSSVGKGRTTDSRASYTALLFAVMNEHTDVAEILLENHADANAKDIDSWTALHYAAQMQNATLLRLLIANGANVSAKAKSPYDPPTLGPHYAPLLFAAGKSGGSVETVRALLESGADPNQIDDEDGTTPLHWAASAGSVEMVQTLLDHGADPWVEDSSGNRAMHYAAEHFHFHVEHILRERALLDQNASKQLWCRPVFEFQCVAERPTPNCIPSAWRCDGQPDCASNVDESESVCEKLECDNSTHFQCGGLRNACIPRKWLCDRKVDCADLSDEMNCTLQKNCNTTREYQCQSGECVEFGWICDGYSDCSDGSDELNCSVMTTAQKTESGPCERPGVCDQICRNSSFGGFKCACHPGYQLIRGQNGTATQCRVLGANPLLVLSAKGEMRQLNLANKTGDSRSFPPSQVSRRFRSLAANSTGTDSAIFDYWYSARKLLRYWSKDKEHDQMMICPLVEETDEGDAQLQTGPSGCENRTLQGYSTSSSVALDWVHGLLFVMGGKAKGIHVIHLGTGLRVTLVSEMIDQTGRLTIDPLMGLIFWSDWFRGVPRIERAGMDGRDRTVIVRDQTVTQPWAMTADLLERRIYWTENSQNEIRSCDYWGQGNRAVVRSKMHLGMPRSIAVFEARVFWSDMHTGVFSANKHRGDNITKLASKPLWESIRVYHQHAQPEFANICLQSNCPEICVPRAKIRKSRQSLERPLADGPAYRCICEEAFDCNHPSSIVNAFLFAAIVLLFVLLIAVSGALFKAYS